MWLSKQIDLGKIKSVHLFYMLLFNYGDRIGSLKLKISLSLPYMCVHIHVYADATD